MTEKSIDSETDLMIDLYLEWESERDRESDVDLVRDLDFVVEERKEMDWLMVRTALPPISNTSSH